MWDYVGIVRTDKRLERAAHRVAAAARRDPGVLRQLPRHRDLLELRNLVQVAELIVRCAKAARKAGACTSAATTRTCCRPTYHHPVQESGSPQRQEEKGALMPLPPDVLLRISAWPRCYRCRAGTRTTCS